MEVLKEAVALLEAGKEYTLNEMKELWWASRINPRDIFPQAYRNGLLEKQVGYDSDGKFVVKYQKAV